MKYGICDVRGLRVCYWCSGAVCICGSRKGGMKAERPEITAEFTMTRGLPEMDRHMTVYGVGRNSAINALAGSVRALSEAGGEYGWINLMGRDQRTIEEKMGCLHLDGTRHPKMAKKKFSSGGTMEQALYSEAADAIVSWPCLVFQTFGLSFVRGVKRGLEHMATGAGVELEIPSDLVQTIPID